MSQVSFTSKIQGLTKSEWSQAVSGGSSGSTGSSSSAISGQMANHLKELASWFAKDENGNIYLTKDENNNARSFWSYGEITAGGSGSGGGEGGGALYALADVKKASGEDKVGRADNTAAESGDILTFNGTKWYASPAPATGVTSISVNGGSAQTGAVSLTIPTTLSQLTADATHRLVTDTQINTWNGKQDAITASNKLAYSLISGTPDLSDMATKTWVGSQGYLTSISEATSSAYGGIKIGYSASGKNYAVQLSSGKAYVNVPWTDTTYTAGTGISISNNAVAISSTYQTYIANGNTAYGWGNHASVGYLTTSAAAATYAPLGGAGASGTWGISITGNAATATNISQTSPVLAASYEADQIWVANRGHDLYWNYWGDGEGYILEHALCFNWYNTRNYFGQIRGGGTNSAGFGWAYKETDSSTFTQLAQLTHYGSLYLRGSLISGGVLKSYRLDIDNEGSTSCIIARGNAITQGLTGNDLAIYASSYRIWAWGTQLRMFGDIVADGEITAGSDLRWKDNITDIDSSLLYKLKPCEWDWKEGHGQGHSAGLIAQSVAEVIPYAVKGDEESGLTLNYNVFHAFEIAEIQNLRRQVAELKLRVNQLEQNA